MNDFNPATRITGNNARGNKRRIGHSKKSSLDASETKENPKKKVAVELPESASCLPTLPGANSFFQNQKRGTKGIRGKVKSVEFTGENLRVGNEDYSTFVDHTSIADPNNKYVDQLVSYHESRHHNQAWLLLLKHNVLVYGLGCKRGLLKNIIHAHLQGEDVIELQGGKVASQSSSAGDKNVKLLLEHICKTILRIRDIDTLTVTLQNQTKLICGKYICYRISFTQY